MIKQVGLSVLIAVVIATAAFAGGGAESEDGTERPVTLRMGNIYPAEDLLSRAMMEIAERANQQSNGSITIQVFPAGQLGDATSQIQGVGVGTQDMFIGASAWMNQYVPDKLLINMFFMMPSEESYQKFLESDLNARFEQEFLEKTGARVIANNFMRAPRQFASRVPLEAPVSYERVKIRVPDSKAFMESVSALGMSPTQIPLGETYLALTQGLVEATELSLDMLYSMKLHEATGNVIMTNHLFDSNVVMVNESTWSSLSQSQREVLISVCQEVGEEYTADVSNSLADIVSKMEAEGTNVITLDANDLTSLRQMVEARSIQLENEGVWSDGLLEEFSSIVE